MNAVTVRDVVEALSTAFPPEWAEPWDAIGLLAGREDAAVRAVLVTLDPTPEAVERASEAGASLLVTHHPAYLQPPARLTGGAGVALTAVERGLSLVCAHTNLDRSPAGAAALPDALGLPAIRPLEEGTQPAEVVTVFVPEAEMDRVADAMAAAGAGRIGLYDRCSFSAPGTGRFTPLPGSEPATGETGGSAAAPEARLEMIAPRGAGARVADAARDAHPYDEPLVMVQECAIARGAARLGRLCDAGGRSVRELAVDAACRLQATPRVIGDPERLVETVAVANGSGGSLVGAAVASGADAFIVGELRYHDALDAAAAGLAVVELGHDASEWPLVPVLAEAVLRTPGLDPSSLRTDAPGTLYWTP